jgi:Tfp pilus assembly protein PilZ
MNDSTAAKMPAARQGILSLTIKDKNALYAADRKSVV